MKDDYLSKMLSDARYASGISQEQIASRLSVSRKTIANWESGISAPTFDMVIKWFNVCDEPIYPYVMKYMHKEELEKMTPKSGSKEVSKALHICIEELTEQYQRELLYILTGSHFSNPFGILDLMTAYLHTPLDLRMNVASNIQNNYMFSQARGMLVSNENVQPNMTNLMECTESAKDAVYSGRKTYFKKEAE